MESSAADFLLLAHRFGADDLDRFAEAEPRLDAYHQQIEHVGELTSDYVPTVPGCAADVVTGNECADGCAAEHQHRAA